MPAAAVALRGLQVPPFLSVPAYHSTGGQEVIELAAMAGLLLEPWQQLVVEHMFGERPDGRLSAFEVAVIVARQNGKGAILEAAELAWLFLYKEPLIVHTAHEVKTAGEAFIRIKTLIENTPELSKRCLKPQDSNGQQAIRTRAGQRLRFLARSKGSGRGFSANKVVLDEAYALDERHMSALFPTMTAMPDPQIVYMSSAPRIEDQTLNALCDRGEAGTSPRLAYFGWSGDRDKPDDDREQWAATNPALGYGRVTEEFIELEYEALKGSPGAFRRERLSIREDPGAGGVIDEATWARLTDPASACGETVAFAVDMPPARNSCTIAAVGVRPDGMFHGEVIEQRPGTDWVVQRLLDLQRWRPTLVVDKGSPAGSLIPDLEAAGLEVLSPTLQQVGAACGDFLDTVLRPDGLRHLGDPLLAAAAKGVTKRDVGDGGFAWARKNTTVDISPLVALTLALWGFKQRPNVVTDITQVVW